MRSFFYGERDDVMSKKEKDIKTNAIRIVAAKKSDYSVHTYDFKDGEIDGVSVAKKTGFSVEKSFKTLVLVGHSKEHYVCVIPVASHLDLKKTATFFGEKNIEMISQRELLPLTGYVHGGCSPIGMKKQFKTAIDDSALKYEYIRVSGGKIGVQIEMRAEDLAAITDGLFGSIIA